MRLQQDVGVTYLEGSEARPRYHDNPELIYVLEGRMALTADGRTYELGPDGFLLVNAGRPYSWKGDAESFVACFELSLDALYEGLHQTPILFWCCSAFDDSGGASDETYGELRKIVKQLLFLGISKDEGCKASVHAEDPSRPFVIQSLSSQLLAFLTRSFLLNPASSGTKQSGMVREDTASERMDRIMDYLRMNYRSPLSLGDVADELALSPAYLSKFIRRVKGETFLALLNEIRLSHALEDLVYSDQSIQRVAMDNGFASIAAFEKVFKERYGQRPSEYRRQKKAESESASMAAGLARDRIRHYLEERPSVQDREAEEFELPRGPGHVMRMSAIVNAGRARDLLKAAVRKEVLLCRDELGCSYIRFWDIFDSWMHLDPKAGASANYGPIDEVLDFLMGAGLRPYIVLGTKRAGASGVVQPVALGDLREGSDSFFVHVIRRYGNSEVATWIFSYPAPADSWFEEEGRFVFRPLDDAQWKGYLDAFDVVSRCLRARIPAARIGGPDLVPQHYGTERLVSLFASWKRRAAQPAFVSFTSFPYQIVQTGDAFFERHRTSMDFAAADAAKVRDALASAGFAGMELHLVECNLTLSDRSHLNDTTMRAAFLVHALCRAADEVDLFGVWNMSDSYSDAADSRTFLFGGAGILAKTSIPKPAFYALSFLGRLYPEVVLSDRDCIVTINRHGHYKILAGYPVRTGASLGSIEGHELSALKMDQMGEDHEHRLVHVQMKAADGCWQIRRYRVNQTMGSILHEWLSLDLTLEMRLQEYEYLQRICIPHLFIEKRIAHGGVLAFDVDLAPNEITYLHVTEFN